MGKYLEHLKECPLVYYIYQRGSYIYGTNTKESKKDYLVIIDSKYTVPKEFRKYKRGLNYGTVRYNTQEENERFFFYEIQEWFKMVLDCNLEPWECACLNKKFVYKEHVKLLMHTEPIKLRLYFQNRLNLVLPIVEKLITQQSYDKARKYLWYLIKDILFINQIMEHHKIIHFDEANKAHDFLFSCSDTDIMKTYEGLISIPKDLFYNTTNALVKQNHVNKLYKYE